MIAVRSNSVCGLWRTRNSRWKRAEPTRRSVHVENTQFTTPKFVVVRFRQEERILWCTDCSHGRPRRLRFCASRPSQNPLTVSPRRRRCYCGPTESSGVFFSQLKLSQHLCHRVPYYPFTAKRDHDEMLNRQIILCKVNGVSRLYRQLGEEGGLLQF